MDLLSSLSSIGDVAVIEGFEPSQAQQAARPARPHASDETGDDAVVALLMKMGFVPGASVELVAIGPGGDPLAIDVRGGRVAIGRSEAHRIRIRRTQAP